MSKSGGESGIGLPKKAPTKELWLLALAVPVFVTFFCISDAETGVSPVMYALVGLVCVFLPFAFRESRMGFLASVAGLLIFFFFAWACVVLIPSFLTYSTAFVVPPGFEEMRFGTTSRLHDMPGQVTSYWLHIFYHGVLGDGYELGIVWPLCFAFLVYTALSIVFLVADLVLLGRLTRGENSVLGTSLRFALALVVFGVPYARPSVLEPIGRPLCTYFISSNEEDPYHQILVRKAGTAPIEHVRIMLEGGAIASSADHEGNTALMHAAQAGRQDVVKLLIECGAGVDARNKVGQTVLMLAAGAKENKPLETIKLLVAHDADLFPVDQKGRNAISHAKRDGVHDVYEFLGLEMAKTSSQIAELRQKGMAFSPEVFGERAYAGDVEAVRLFLGGGIDASAGRALHWAARRGRFAVAKLLVEHGAKMNRKLGRWESLKGSDGDGYTPLHCAVTAPFRKDNPDWNLPMVEFLLENGADPTIEDSGSKTPEMRCWPPCVGILAATRQARAAAMPGLTPNQKALAERGYYEFTADEYLRSASRGDATALRLFLAEGIDLRTKDEKGQTALMLAAENGGAEAVEFLLAKGAEVNARSKDGESALLMASEYRFRKDRGPVIKILLEAGADPAAKTLKGDTPLERTSDGHSGSRKIKQLIREALDK